MTDTILTSLDVSKRPRTADEAAVWYAAALGWPVTPGIGLDSDATHSRTPSEGLDCSGAWLAPGPWQWAASAVPDLVRTVWRLSPGSPVLAVLGRPVPGARRLGIVDVPSLVGVAAL